MRRSLAILLFCIAALLTACGGDDSNDTTTTPAQSSTAPSDSSSGSSTDDSGRTAENGNGRRADRKKERSRRRTARSRKRELDRARRRARRETRREGSKRGRPQRIPVAKAPKPGSEPKPGQKAPAPTPEGEKGKLPQTDEATYKAARFVCAGLYESAFRGKTQKEVATDYARAWPKDRQDAAYDGCLAGLRSPTPKDTEETGGD